MFNLLHITSGDKVDFWLLTGEPFDVARFARRIPNPVFIRELWVSTPEDTILAKLRWSKNSGRSEKQRLDALGVFELQRPCLDINYLAEWVERLDLQAEWNRLLAQHSDP